MPHTSAPNRQRQLIANAAARLMAESGLADPALAKRKAALSLGLTENVALPDNAEVETELRLYQRLFQEDEHAERIGRLRRLARSVMARLQAFNPYLVGSVLDGSAGRHAEIDVQLFTDSAKDVEIFLLNHSAGFVHSVPRSERAEAVLTLQGEEVPVNLVIYPYKDERITLRTRDGRIRPRMRLEALDRLIKESCDALPE